MLDQHALEQVALSYLARSQQPLQASQGRLKFVIAKTHCGWIAQDIAQRLAATYTDQVDCSEHTFVLPRQECASSLLANMSATLRESACLPKWRNELLDVRSLQDNTVVLAQIERAAARVFGIATRSVHLSAWTSDQRILLAQRAWTKAIDPGLWDTLVGGMIAAHETDTQALHREAAEEAGLQTQDLFHAKHLTTFLVQRPLPEGCQFESVVLSGLQLLDGTKLQNQDGEVIKIAPFTLDQVLTLLQQEQLTLEAGISSIYALRYLSA